MVGTAMLNVGAALAKGDEPRPEPPPDDPMKGNPPAKRDLAGQWNEFLNQPGNAAALIQFGIKALQSVSPGQSTMGHIANAIGAAGEAKQRVVEGQTERRYKDAQTQLLESRGDFYKSGGGLTAYQQAMMDARNDTRILEGMKDYLLYGGGEEFAGILDPVELPPDQFMDLYTRIKQRMSPVLTQPGGQTSLGGAIDPNRARADAASAISRGAPRDQVLKRLQDMGISTEGL
jgi:hypothetical protein